MTRLSAWLVIGLGSVALCAGMGLVLWYHTPARVPIYTLSQLLGTRSQRLPMGSVVGVRGVLTCPVPPVCILTDPQDATVVSKVILGRPIPLSILRGVPVLGRLLPPLPDHPVTGQIARYLISKQTCSSPRARCGGEPGWVLESGGS